MLAKKKEQKIMSIGQHIRINMVDCKLIASGQYIITLDPNSRKSMYQSSEFLQAMIDKRVQIYGVNTQFGDQVNYIDPSIMNQHHRYYQSIEERQKNLIKSHASGLGNVVNEDVVRLAMVLRAHCLSQGYSGVRPEAVEALLELVNQGIVPVVRQYGSIGASGDLIPLASMAVAVIGGDVDVNYRGQIMPATEALRRAGLKPFTPKSREGLAMINGTSFMTAIASIAIVDLQRLFRQMLTAIAIMLESMRVIQSAYHPLVHTLKKQQGEIEINNYLLKTWKDSQLLVDLDELRLQNKENSLQDEHEQRRVQDYYSLRSVAQGFGPFLENLRRATDWIENEINSVNDNPIIDVNEAKIHHGANFMGYYVTDACDILKMDIAQASTWLHALLANIVHPRKNNGLPTSLVQHPERNNGFRPLQLLAASITVQNRKLAQAHQAFMLPTEGDNQDVNSLATHAAFDLRESVDNLERLTAIMLLAGVQALEHIGVERASKIGQQVHQQIRKLCPVIDECRPLTREMNSVIEFLKTDQLATQTI